jgi:hypothetical protein
MFFSEKNNHVNVVELLDGSKRYIPNNIINNNIKLPTIKSLDIINSASSANLLTAFSFEKDSNFSSIYKLLNATSSLYDEYDPNGHRIIYIKSNIIPAISGLKDLYGRNYETFFESASFDFIVWHMDSFDPSWRHKLAVEKQLKLEPSKPVIYPFSEGECTTDRPLGRSNSYFDFASWIDFYDQDKIARLTRREISREEKRIAKELEKERYQNLSLDERKNDFEQEIAKTINLKIQEFFDYWTIESINYRQKYSKVQDILDNYEHGKSYLTAHHPNVLVFIDKAIIKVKENLDINFDMAAKNAKAATTLIGSISDLALIISGFLNVLPDDGVIKPIMTTLTLGLSTTKALSSGYTLQRNLIAPKNEAEYKKFKGDLVKDFIWKAALCNPEKFILLQDSGIKYLIKNLVKFTEESIILDTTNSKVSPENFANNSYIAELGFSREWNSPLYTNDKSLMTIGDLLSSYDQQICYDKILGEIHSTEAEL